MGELTPNPEAVGANIPAVVLIGTGTIETLAAAALVAQTEAVSSVKKLHKPLRDRVEQGLILRLLPIVANLTKGGCQCS